MAILKTLGINPRQLAACGTLRRAELSLVLGREGYKAGGRVCWRSY